MTLQPNDIFAAVQLTIITPEEARKLLGIEDTLKETK